jgi:predicted dithiol-disulfide oxidoreductase (DUF899 family)
MRAIILKEEAGRPNGPGHGAPRKARFGVSGEHGESFALSVFLRDGEEVYLAYRTSARGTDRLRFDFNLLDLTPLGRQERWEDSPPGWPQSEPYVWWRKHDEYELAPRVQTDA